MRRDIKDYDFFKLFGGRVKFEDHAYPFKNLGDVPEVTPPTVNFLFCDVYLLRLIALVYHSFIDCYRWKT